MLLPERILIGFMIAWRDYIAVPLDTKITHPKKNPTFYAVSSESDERSRIDDKFTVLCCKILIHRNLTGIFFKWTIGCKDTYAGYNAKCNKSKQYYSIPSHL